jgi:2-dehydro-3-deoxy-D-arabinonate dehydratase
MPPLLTRHQTPAGVRWALDGRLLSPGFSLSAWLAGTDTSVEGLRLRCGGELADGALLAPVDPQQEVWASGVTYLSSRLAREAESQSRDVYQKVYAAERPELFFKAVGWRVRGHGESIHVRADSAWNVPEPEIVLVLDVRARIVGYTVGNDVSSRSIEGENPLYLPQAKVYDASCAIGPGIRLCDGDALRDLPIAIEVRRGDAVAFRGETRSAQIRRRLPELAQYLYRELSFPHGALLFTGTGIVPGEEFTLCPGDHVGIEIDGLRLENTVR